MLVGEAHCAGLFAGQGGVCLGAAGSAGSRLSCTLWGLLGPWGAGQEDGAPVGELLPAFSGLRCCLVHVCSGERVLLAVPGAALLSEAPG